MLNTNHGPAAIAHTMLEGADWVCSTGYHKRVITSFLWNRRQQIDGILCELSSRASKTIAARAGASLQHSRFSSDCSTSVQFPLHKFPVIAVADLVQNLCVQQTNFRSSPALAPTTPPTSPTPTHTHPHPPSTSTTPPAITTHAVQPARVILIHKLHDSPLVSLLDQRLQLIEAV